MIDFFRNLRIDRLSFWIGFLVATVLWWLVTLLQPVFQKLWERFRENLGEARRGLQANIEQRHRADTLKYAQGLHLAAPLFSLDEVLIPPRLMAPPVAIIPGEEPPTIDSVSLAVPFMPDWPELASAYGGHTLSLEDALSENVNLIVVGPVGSGKTTALAHLASVVARNEAVAPNLIDRIPILIHTTDILKRGVTDSLISTITEAVAAYSSPLSASRLPNYLNDCFDTGRVLLLIDGMDELPPDEISRIVADVQEIIQDYPQTLIVISADSRYQGGLPGLGFATIPMAIWGPREQAEFAKKWGNLWTWYIDTELSSVTPLLLNGWLLNRVSALTPLEFTLQLWATYAGDVRGPTLSDAIEAYLRRMTASIAKGRFALEQFATQEILSLTSWFSYQEAEQWASELTHEAAPEPYQTQADQETPDEGPKSITIPRILPELAKSGLLTQQNDDQIRFIHPIIPCYLAGKALADSNSEEIFSHPDWPLRDITIRFMATHQDISAQANILLGQTGDPVRRGPIFVGEWLPSIPIDSPWRKIILGRLSNLLSDEVIPLGVRGRILSALVKTKDPDIPTLFRHLLKSNLVSVRHLAALGSGYQRDTQAVNQLIQLLADQPVVSRAACLALVNIGTKPALEATATALLQGSEEVRQAVAEAFANHPEEGHPTLREASSLDDLLVRRASIHGLKRIKQPWAIKILEEMQIEDAQWVVKNAAAQTMEELNQPDIHIPRPLNPLAELPWLINFATKRGGGVSTGEPARQLLAQVLSHGSEEEQLAAMDQIQKRAYGDVFPDIFDQLQGSDLELREAAYHTIWQLAAAGVEIPSPVKYGLG